MKPLVVIPSTGDRETMLRRLLASIEVWPERDAYDYCLVLQGYRIAQLTALHVSPLGDELIAFPELMGPHVARQAALNAFRRSAYVMLDDDQAMLPDTSFKQALELAAHPLTGLVCIRQATSPTLVEQRRTKVRGVEQSPFVCTDGGMALAGHTADVIRDLPPADFLCDNTEWSLATYTSGLMNLIDHDHWSLHWPGSKGGRRASPGQKTGGWLSTPKQLPDPRYVRMRNMETNMPEVCPENRFYWNPRFTDAAHALHHEGARRRVAALQRHQ
jgi:hypothetical protein